MFRLRALGQTSKAAMATVGRTIRPAFESSLRRSSAVAVGNSVRFYASNSEKVVAYTVDKFPGYVRNDKFKKLNEQDVEYFKTIVGENGVVYGNEDDLFAYNTDWMNKFRGKSQLALKPKTTQQVSAILKYCNEQKIAVVPQGGNTGLVGGSVPVFDEVVLSLQSMNKIRSFDSVSGILTADAGCVLEVLDNWLGEKGYMMPLDLGAKGSCQIGGNIATNAGGLRLLRYGSLHGTVLGLEVVLPDGTILDNMSTLRKDNTGYDLKQLFIGSEGTVGVVTGVSILTPHRSKANKDKAVNVALLGLNSFEDVQKAFKQSRVALSEILSAFEFWDINALHMFKKHATPKEVMQSEYPFYVLIETSGSNKDHDDEKLTMYLENMMEDGVAQDGVVAQDETQIRSLWSLREGFTEALGKEPAVYKYDISMPVPKLYECVEDMRQHLRDGGVFGQQDSPVTDVVAYGHVGDGNLHLNIAASRLDKKVSALIEPYLFEWVSKHQGSISAEHGLGVAKNEFLGYSKSPVMIQLMKTMKNMLDPNGIMNPYKNTADLSINMTSTELRQFALIRSQAVEWKEFTATNEWADDALRNSSLEDSNLHEHCIAVYYVVDKEQKTITNKLHVVTWSPEFKEVFQELSLGWVKELYVVEESDRRQVENPEESIIKPGGQVFILLDGDKVVGSVALVVEHGHCELGKMAISKEYQGKGFAHPLMIEFVAWAKKLGFPEVTILTDYNLVKAVSLYEKYGFKIIQRGEHPKYKRVNTIMRLEF
ncbi:hypothetical protein EC973_003936 [Apophysomyces ossiformis]|uniref:D-2-hydroxyglutarate dehydrogenase, mitochondrial n=1 Tax=Apophysomyces ossiformis TaxID=679940 RepID=A0A8H7EKU5_9FUNG|nr:hypothetical protein EC973_003936 [Apophysomyces ossiformis]